MKEEKGDFGANMEMISKDWEEETEGTNMYIKKKKGGDIIDEEREKKNIKELNILRVGEGKGDRGKDRPTMKGKKWKRKVFKIKRQ